MGDLHQLADLRDVEREASEWIARLTADDASADERAQYESWRAGHPRRGEVFDEMMVTWRRFAAAGPIVRAVSFAHSVSAQPEVEASRSRWVMAAAASVVTFLLLASYFAPRFSGNKFGTAIGEQLSISLPDGSTVQLNSNSSARVDFDNEARIIRLERGEAFFKVAHDANRPFWVVTGKSWVRAVGTEFSVHVRSTGVQVIVNEGVVKVGNVASIRRTLPSESELSNMAASVLTAGHEADVQGEATVTKGLSSEELVHSMSWRYGTLYFENEPLADVVDEVGRYTPVKLVIADAQLRQLQIGGTFRANPQGAEALLTMLEQGLGLTVRRDGDRAYIDKNLD